MTTGGPRFGHAAETKVFRGAVVGTFRTPVTTPATPRHCGAATVAAFLVAGARFVPGKEGQRDSWNAGLSPVLVGETIAHLCLPSRWQQVGNRESGLAASTGAINSKPKCRISNDANTRRTIRMVSSGVLRGQSPPVTNGGLL